MNLQRLIEQYISFRQSLGSPFTSEAVTLRAFGRVRGTRASIASVRVEHVDAFLGKARPVTRYWFVKLNCLRPFLQYAVSRGYITKAPLPTVMPKQSPAFVPYIYTREELHCLFQAIEPHPRGNSVLEPATIRTMILVYYGAGLRLCEATNLTRADVDLSRSLLTIRNTKFGKTRLVPVGPQLTRALVQYDSSRRRGRPVEAPFFATAGGGPINTRTLEKNFRVVCDRAGIRRTDTHEQPRIHDFAIRSPFTVSPPGISRARMCSDSCIICRSISVMSICRTRRCT